MPARRIPGARPEALFQPPPERQPLAARMRPRTFDVEDGTVTLIGATTENPYSADLSLRAGLAA